MQPLLLIVLAAVSAVALAEGQYYVPRAYYTIDPEGHASHPIPLRRLRRSLMPYPNWGGGARANANANAVANSWGGPAIANANALARSEGAGGGGGWGQPAPGGYGATNPALGLGAGQIRRMSGPILGGSHSVTASSSVGLDPSGGYYDQYTSVN